jgi:hypothetical protein
MAKRNNREHDLQVSIFEWAEMQKGKFPELALLFAVPNAAKRSPRQGAYMKAEGMKAGVPDIWLPVARGGFHGLVIEVKPEHTPGVTTKTYPTAEQKDWIERLNTEGYLARICYGFVEIYSLILDYLGEHVRVSVDKEWERLNKIAAVVFGIPYEQIISSVGVRKRNTSTARATVMYTLRKQGWSLQRIADSYHKDHSTVWGACQRVQQWIDVEDPYSIKIRKVINTKPL